jgi:uncharacterized repeat protein (TIGR03806 family)
MRFATVVLFSLFALGCQLEQSGPLNFRPDDYPALLSEWQLMEHDGQHLQIQEDVLPYDLRTPLFSDYALKLRTVWMPAGTSAIYNSSKTFDFPVGTIISKTFYYPRDPEILDAVLRVETDIHGFADNGFDLSAVRLIETRLLVRQETGWDALPYVWNSEQTDAKLQLTGAIQRLKMRDSAELGKPPIEFAYIVPNQNECAGCHAVDQNDGQLHPIGPASRHLDKTFAHYPEGPDAQLQHWAARGLLSDLPANTIAGSLEGTEQKARAYLDINCGHCHQPGGSADTSGLFLHAAETSLLKMGVCKPPVAAGRGTGGHSYSIVPGAPDESILLLRMNSKELDIKMPELGRSLVHSEGVELMRSWIEQLHGECAAPG